MKNKIERTLFWFKEGEVKHLHLDDRFFGMATLLNRLLNKKYIGKKIQFINIYFSSRETYNIYPAIPMNYVNYFGGHLAYYGVFDFNEFNLLSANEQNYFIWKKACDDLKITSEFIRNTELFQAADYAYNTGLELKLNPDYVMVDRDFNVDGQEINISIWVDFSKMQMISKLIVKKNDEIIFEKEIDRAKMGAEIFLEMYKNIEIKGDKITVTGKKDISYLPLVIPLESIFNNSEKQE